MQAPPVHFSLIEGAKYLLPGVMRTSFAGPSVECAHLPLLMLVLIAPAAAALVYMLLLLLPSASRPPKRGPSDSV